MIDKDFMKKGLFNPEHVKRVNEMRKTWKFVYPTQESVSRFFEGVRKDIEEDLTGFWTKLKNKTGE